MQRGEQGRALLPADYESIHAAVVETTRGRWFLEEFARRNRQADTQMILDELRALAAGGASAQADGEVVDSPAVDALTLASASGPLIAQGRDALFAILAAAERIQETGWRLQSRGSDPECCGVIDAQVRAIYAAAPLQELALLGLSATRNSADVQASLEGAQSERLASETPAT